MKPLVPKMIQIKFSNGAHYVYVLVNVGINSREWPGTLMTLNGLLRSLVNCNFLTDFDQVIILTFTLTPVEISLDADNGMMNVDAIMLCLPYISPAQQVI